MNERTRRHPFLTWLRDKLVAVVISLSTAATVLSALNDKIAKPASELGLPSFLTRYAVFVSLTAATITFSFLVYTWFQLHVARQQLKKGRKSDAEFRLLALENAQCDRDIINTLHSELLAHDVTTSDQFKRRVDQLRTVYTNNIQSVLNLSSVIFSDITERKCSVSIRLIGSHDQHVKVSRTVMRNRESGMDRGLNATYTSPVTDNTANVEILERGRPYFASRDLLQDRSEGKYVNTRQNWDKDYTSTLVRGIPELGQLGFTPDLGQRISLHTPDSPHGYIGFFCVDAKDAALDSDMCVSYSQEFCWQIASSLYGLKLLDQIVSKAEGLSLPST